MNCKIDKRSFAHKVSGLFFSKVRVTALMLCLCAYSTYASTTFAQLTLPPLNLNNVSIDQIIAEIENSSDYVFLVADDAKHDLQKKVSVNTDGQTVTEVMNQVLQDTQLSYMVSGNQVAVYKESTQQPAASTRVTAQPEGIQITGLIKDEDGHPLAGVAVMLKSNRNRATTTTSDGHFTLPVTSYDETLVLYFIGMNEQEINLRNGVTNYNVTMTYSSSAIGEVVVSTGMFVRDKITDTGASSTFSGEELKRIGNVNVLQSLKTVEPSFIMLDNLEMGSNPNSMPNIELRGQASITEVTDEFGTDPNQPLFILNGVEVAISRIMDLDINRVESVTVLKDASSAAIYGSKAANGVVVIETIKPKAGEYRIYYNADLSVDAPDLSVYNMMNAREKLMFEEEAGMYKAEVRDPSAGEGTSRWAASQLYLDALYNYRLHQIAQGVDTYWLSEPVRTGFTHGHSIRVSGGSEALSVDIGARFKDNMGVMKGSTRKTWEGNAALVYRHKQFIISNTTNVGGYRAIESPYGDYQNWVNASPYYTKVDENGLPPKYMIQPDMSEVVPEYMAVGDVRVNEKIANPLHNGTLTSRNESENLYVENVFSLQYDMDEHLQLRGGLNMRVERGENVKYFAPEDTRFEDVENNRKGTLNQRTSKLFHYKAFVQGSYARIFNEHTITAIARAELAQTNNESLTLDAEGFPYGSKGRANQAIGYVNNGRPGAGYKQHREVGLMASVNYNYQRKYLLDLVYRLDGATTFGSEKLFHSFWSAGIGWNIDREDFAKNWNWVDLFKVRASMGTTSNQNIGTVYANTIYQYYTGANAYGQGAYVNNLGTPGLPWQVSHDIGAGIDLRAFKGRLSLTFDVYRKKVDPLIIHVAQIPSTGVSTLPMDLGHLTNKGFDVRLNFSPFRKSDQRIDWMINLTASHVVSEYGGLGNTLNTENERIRNLSEDDNTMRQYRDGYQTTYIWAVKTGGIDPSNGQEIFIKKDGTRTHTYNASDWVVVGNERPDLQGIVGTSFRYKDFYFGINFRYSIGSDVYNDALYTKVENITKEGIWNNQDKRALYQRWRNPGDNAQFKGIGIVGEASRRTSRFVQKNNYLRAESITFSYELNQNEWLKRNVGIQNMRFNFYCYDLFRLETSKVERGTSYPFARSFALGINLSF